MLPGTAASGKGLVAEWEPDPSASEAAVIEVRESSSNNICSNSVMGQKREFLC